MPLKIWDEEDGQGSLFMELKVRHVKMPISWRSTNINTDQEKDTKFLNCEQCSEMKSKRAQYMTPLDGEKIDAF